MNDSHGFVSTESCTQLGVYVELHFVAVLAGFAGSINVEDRGVKRRGEGRGQPQSQAAECPLGSEAGSENQTDRLSGLGCFKVRFQVDLAFLPQIGMLIGKLGLKKGEVM